MKKYILLGFLLGSVSVKSQNHLDIGLSYGYSNPTAWNRSISAYNFARPWLKQPLPLLHNTMATSLSFSGVIARGLFLSPTISHSKFNSRTENLPSKAAVQIRWMQAGVGLDIYPMEFGLDSVGYRIRPFVRLGGGATALMPRVYINDSLSTVDDEPYKPLVWSYYFNGGIGCRISITRIIDATPYVGINYFPSIDLEDFNYALHGTAVPNLTNVQKALNLQAGLSLSIRLGAKKEDEVN